MERGQDGVVVRLSRLSANLSLREVYKKLETMGA